MANPSSRQQPTIAVALSGGMDSAAAAGLLLDQGFKVIALTLQMTEYGTEICKPAKHVARMLGIPIHVINVTGSFHTRVITPFLEDYLAGKTPNPCTLCNPTIKWGELLPRARTLGASALATGHYAVRVRRRNGRFAIHRGSAPERDQSYFLFALSQQHLAYTRFPLGDWTKHQVSAYVQERKLVPPKTRESREICFIPNDNYAAFIFGERGHAADQPGFLTDQRGNILGQHAGIHNFTIGQRRGLGIAVGHPMYVLSIDPLTGNVIIGEEKDLFRRCFQVGSMHWMGIPPPSEPFTCRVQIRYRHKAVPALVKPAARDSSIVEVEFDQAQRAIAPGQAAVFYSRNLILGGGWILRTTEVH